MSDSVSFAKDTGTITVGTTGTSPNYYYDTSSPNINDWQYKSLCPSIWTPLYNNKKGDDDMRYLYEVILVNPKNDAFRLDTVVAKSETSALLKAYEYSDFSSTGLRVEFDDLKTSCHIIFEWKKEVSNNG